MSQPRTIIWARHVVCREYTINAYMVSMKEYERRTFEKKILKLTLMGGLRMGNSGWLS
jgi:hypothetical protein